MASNALTVFLIFYSNYYHKFIRLYPAGNNYRKTISFLFSSFKYSQKYYPPNCTHIVDNLKQIRLLQENYDATVRVIMQFMLYTIKFFRLRWYININILVMLHTLCKFRLSISMEQHQTWFVNVLTTVAKEKSFAN